MRDELEQTVGAIIATTDEGERRRMLRALAAQDDAAAARALIALYARAPWNDMRRQTITALGDNGHERAVLALVRLMRDRGAAHTSAAATLALGATRSTLAGECLLVELHSSDHALRREVPTALGHLDRFDSAPELVVMLAKAQTLQKAALEALVLALGRHCATAAWPMLRGLLERRSKEREQSAEQSASRLDDALLLSAGMLGDAGAEALLARFPCQQESFSHELRLASIERLHQRKRQTVDDALADLMGCDDETSTWEAARRLRHFPIERTQPALTQHIAAMEPWRAAIVASVLPLEPRTPDWLAERATVLPAPLSAAWVRMSKRLVPRFMEQLQQTLPQEPMLELSCNLACAELSGWMAQLAREHPKLPLRIAAINALAAQGVMAEPGSEAWMDIALSVRRLVRQPGPRQANPAAAEHERTESDRAVRDRAVRALGQQGGRDPHALELLEAMLADEPGSRGSAYAAIASLGSAEAAQIVWRRLAQLVPDDREELARALETLATVSVAADAPHALGRLLPHVPDSARSALLRVLGSAQVDGATPLVLSAMADSSQFVRLLGVFAARLNNDAAVRAELLRTADDPDPVLRSAATYALAQGGRSSEQAALLDKLLRSDVQLAANALRHLQLAPNESSEPVTAALDRAIRASAGLDPKVLAAAIELRDRLAVVVAEPMAAIIEQAVPQALASDVDAKLGASIRDYGRFSAEVKAALRNAELTFAHPELFDASVDKSTMVVEYVKAIDLLFQEHLGRELARDGQRIAEAMQSRIIQLGLDDEALDATEMMRLIGCTGYFKREEFPAHKLTLIVRSLMSGRAGLERQRTLDGLRAWAVLILLFARRFEVNGQKFLPLLSMRSSDPDATARAAAALVRLQDVRNDVAHRGTMLMLEDVTLVRTRAITLLNELTGLLP